MDYRFVKEAEGGYFSKFKYYGICKPWMITLEKLKSMIRSRVSVTKE